MSMTIAILLRQQDATQLGLHSEPLYCVWWPGLHSSNNTRQYSDKAPINVHIKIMLTNTATWRYGSVLSFCAQTSTYICAVLRMGSHTTIQSPAKVERNKNEVDRGTRHASRPAYPRRASPLELSGSSAHHPSGGHPSQGHSDPKPEVPKSSTAVERRACLHGGGSSCIWLRLSMWSAPDKRFDIRV